MLFAPPVLIDISDMTILLWYIVSFFIFLLLLTIVLKIALSFAKNEQHKKFGEVFVTSLIIVLVIFICNIFLAPLIALIIGLVLMWIIIAARHNIGFVAAIGVSVIALILAIVLLIVVQILLNALGLNVTLVSFF